MTKGPARPGMLSLAELEKLVAAGEIDTVIVAFTDMQGRLTGKRISARLFVDDVIAHGAECCNYLLAVDVDMNTVDGYAMSSWEAGYGDMVMTPDFSTLRLLPWLPGTALVMADLGWHDGSPVVPAPRGILRTQLDRLADTRHGAPSPPPNWSSWSSTTRYREAWSKRLPGPDAGHRLQHRLRDAGLHADGAAAARHPRRDGGRWAVLRGRQGRMQPRASRRSDSATTTRSSPATTTRSTRTAPRRSPTSTARASRSWRNSMSAKATAATSTSRSGATDGSAVFADDDDPLGMSAMFRSFVAGQLATLRELTLFYAPNINSYKRFVDGSFAPTAVAWGMDNRTCALRVVGHGHGMRMECRAPGGDVNQYLAVAALIAGGLHGIEQELELPDACAGNAYTSGAERLPTTLAEAAAAVREVDRGARGVRRRGRRALPEQRPRRARRRSTPRSPIGRGGVASNGSDPVRGAASARTDHLPAAGADRRVGRAGQLPARHLRRRGHHGGRHRDAAAAAAGRRRHRGARARRPRRAGASPAAATSTRPPTVSSAHPTTDEPARDRDALEFALLRGALARAAAACSASAAAHRFSTSRWAARCTSTCPTCVGHTRHQAGNAVFTTSSIQTVPGTRLAALIGESTDAQCYHHQAIDRAGRGADRVRAWDGVDGVIEAVEMPGEDFVLAVQWHPEERLDDLRLFAGSGARPRRHMQRERCNERELRRH